MQRHRSEPRDGGYIVVPFHVPFSGRKWRWWWFNIRPSEEHYGGLLVKALHDTMGAVWWLF